jgi:predicted ATPase/DNA-binding SARP family transcriptional activator
MRISVLGPIRAWQGEQGQPVALGGSRARALLAALVLRAGQVVPAERLIEDLWGSDPPAGAVNALQAVVSRLRKALGAEVIESRAPGYRLAVDPEAVDAARFERLAAEGRGALAAGDAASAASALRVALGLWQGPALADCADQPFAQGAVVRLEELRLGALEDRIEADLALGGGRDLVAELEALAVEHPLRERPRGQLMRALYRSGRQADALTLYADTRTTLADQLGVDPGPELQALHLAMLRQDPALAGTASALDPASASGAAPTPGSPRTPNRALGGPPDSRLAETSEPALELSTASGQGRRVQQQGNLPARLTSFVGRDQAVAAVARRMRESRLVTLTGAGGAGKTRLAVETAATVASQAPDGVWLVELAPLRDPASVPAAALAAFGIRDAKLYNPGGPGSAVGHGGGDPLARLVEALTDKDLLLVLDNCEHLADAAARLAGTVLAACPRVRILATSREPLEVTGEALWPVPPLDVPPADAAPVEATGYPAVRLLADRARAARPGFSLGGEGDGNGTRTGAAAAEICRRLDGMPLAIELAAARLRSLSTEQIAARLDDRFQLLTGGSRTALPRQQTLRAVVDWSWELLDKPEQALLARLSVFSGGCTLEAAERVCADPDPDAEPRLGAGSVLDLLASLVDKSLLVTGETGGEVRYGMLETIRAYAGERLVASGEADRFHRVHAGYFRDLAELADAELRGSGQLPWLDRLEPERDNFRTALRWAIGAGDATLAVGIAGALSWFWWLRGSRSEGYGWLTVALALPNDNEAVEGAGVLDRARAAGMRALLSADTQTGLEGSIRAAEQAVALYEAGGAGDSAMARLLQIVATLMRGDRRLVLDTAEGMIATSRARGDRWEAAIGLLIRSRLLVDEGDPAAAERDAVEALEAFRAVGELWGQFEAFGSLAEVFAVRGAYRRAAAYGEEAVGVAERLGDREEMPILLITLAGALELAGEHTLARAKVERAMELARRFGLYDSIAYGYATLALIARCAGDLRAARRHLEHGLAELETGQRHTGPVMLRARLLADLGVIAELEGDLRRGHPLLLEALDLSANAQDARTTALAVEGLAGAAAAAGEAERAATLLGFAEALRGGAQLPPEQRGDVERAAASAQAALGPRRFEEALRAGGAMTWEAGVRFASGSAAPTAARTR